MEIRIGPAIEQLLVYVDVEDRVGVIEKLKLGAREFLAEPTAPGGDDVLRRLEEIVFHLETIGVRGIDGVVGGGRIDRRPVVDRLVFDRGRDVEREETALVANEERSALEVAHGAVLGERRGNSGGDGIARGVLGEELDLTIFDPRGQFTGEIGRTAHETGGQVGVLVHGKRSGAHAIARDGLRGGVPRRLARRNPLGDRIARHEGIGPAGEVGVALGAAVDRGVGERPGEKRNLPAADALRRGLAREALAVVHGGDAQRESVRDQRAVQIEALAATAKTV